MNYPKAILVGMDGAMFDMVDHFIDDLPNFKKMREHGFFAPAHSCPTVDTPTNWTTIVTGSNTGTHGITSFGVHSKGNPVTQSEYSFNNNHLCKSEYIWQALEKQGKKSILLNYPCGWPPTLENGIVVGGDGVASFQWNVGNAISYHTESVTDDPDGLCETGELSGWENLPEHKNALEIITPFHGGQNVKWTSAGLEKDEDAEDPGSSGPMLFIAVLDTEGKGFDTAVIAGKKDGDKPLAVLKEGEWSPVAEGIFGKENEHCGFRFKLQELSSDGVKVNIIRTQAYTTEGWGYPESVCEDLRKNVGSFIEGVECVGLPNTPPEMKNEQIAVHFSWFLDASKYLLSEHECDFLAIQLHSNDGMNHSSLAYVCPDSRKYDPDKAGFYLDQFKENYRVCDEFIGKLMDECMDENTVFAVVSDHACQYVDTIVWTGGALLRKGLTQYKPGEKKGQWNVDIEKSKVCPTAANYMWVNLKGREEGGIVEPGDEYEQVVKDTIDALYSLYDPRTGECPIARACHTRDAEDLGQSGPDMPDIVYFFKPGYTDYPLSYTSILSSRHGMPDMMELAMRGGFAQTATNGHHHMCLPDAKAAGISNRAIFGMIGKGVKGGTTLDHINLTDVTPTLARLLDADPPANIDGRVINEGLE